MSGLRGTKELNTFIQYNYTSCKMRLKCAIIYNTGTTFVKILTVGKKGKIINIFLWQQCIHGLNLNSC